MENKEFSCASAFNSNESIPYTKGALVSETITKRPEGTVTLFAFAKSQSLNGYAAPYDAQVHIPDGTAAVYLGRQPFVLHKDDRIIMPAHVAHVLKATGKFNVLLRTIKSKQLPS